MRIRGRWWVLALIAVVIAGNYYAWDSIAPVADLLRRQRGFSQSDIGLLNAVYAVPNIPLSLVGGIHQIDHGFDVGGLHHPVR